MQHSIHRHRFLARLATAVLTLWATSACSTSDGLTTPGAAWSVEFSSSSLSFTAMNTPETVTATIRDNKGQSIPDATVSWSSENPSVAEVSGGGRTVQIIAKSPGATNIRAKSGSAEATVIVTVAGVKSVIVDPANVAMRINDTRTMSAQLNTDPGVSHAVTWSSANPTIVTISPQGVITAVAPGATTVTATANADTRFKGTAQIAIAPIRGLVVAPSTANLTVGQTQLFSATVSLPDGQNTAVAWSSNDPSVATVSAQGTVTAVSVGSTAIIATSVADTTLKATALLSVTPTIQSVSVTPVTAQLFIGQTQPLTATVVGDAGLSHAVQWLSSNSTIASVSSAGVVTAHATGNAVITARSVADNSKSATASINISSRPLTVTIAQSNFSLVLGATAALVATVEADPGVSTAVTWSSSSPSVATVSASGLVTAVADGSSLITATSVADPSKKASVTATVSGSMANNWNASRINGALYEDVISLYTANDNEAYAVNIHGDIYRFDGSTWTLSLSGNAHGTTFSAIHGLGSDVVVAVGSNGRIFRRQGTSWSQMTSGTATSLNAVYVSSTDAMYAVGDNGIALRYNGTTWATSSTGTNESWRSVWGSAGFAAAVGDNGKVALFWGASWSLQESGTIEHLHGVAGFSSSNLVAVGDFGTMLRFNGTSWNKVNTHVVADLMSVVAVPDQNLYYTTGSFGTVLRVGESSLAPVATPYGTRFITSSLSPNGELWTAGQRGIVQRYKASSWEVVNLAPDLIDVWSTSSSNAWAVGEFGFIYHFDGSSWTRKETPTRERLNAVWGLSPSFAFAGGDGGLMLRWNGTSWVELGFPSDNDVLAIWGQEANAVYAVTFGGEIARWDGLNWALVHSQGSSLYGIYGSASNNIFAIGDGGTVIHYNGTTWSSRNLNQTALLVGLWTSEPGNVVTVGLSPADPTLGAAYRYNGSTWSPSVLPAAQPELTSVWGVRSTDLYATGGAGSILRFNGASWQPMSSGTNDYLWAVTGSPSGNDGAIAVGYNATVVHGSNGVSAHYSESATSRLTNLRGGIAKTGRYNPSARSKPATASVIPDGEQRKSPRARKSLVAGSRAALR